jgi:hypothetical protein
MNSEGHYLDFWVGNLDKIEKTLEAKDLERFQDLKSYFSDLDNINLLIDNDIFYEISKKVLAHEIFKKASYKLAIPKDGQEEVAKDLESELELLGGCSKSLPSRRTVFSMLVNLFQKLKTQRDTNIDKYAEILSPTELILFLLKLFKEEFEKHSMEGSDVEKRKQLQSFMEVINGVLSETPKKPKKSDGADSKKTDGKKSSDQNSNPPDNFARNMKILGVILVILAVLGVIAFFVFKKLNK